MDQKLLDSLVCPVCHGTLVVVPSTATVAGPQAMLSCPADRLHYPIDEGVPVLLMSRATAWPDPADTFSAYETL